MNSKSMYMCAVANVGLGLLLNYKPHVRFDIHVYDSTHKPVHDYPRS